MSTSTHKSRSSKSCDGGKRNTFETHQSLCNGSEKSRPFPAIVCSATSAQAACTGSCLKLSFQEQPIITLNSYRSLHKVLNLTTLKHGCTANNYRIIHSLGSRQSLEKIHQLFIYFHAMSERVSEHFVKVDYWLVRTRS